METMEQTSQDKGLEGPKNRTINVFVRASQLFPLDPTEVNVDNNTELKDDKGSTCKYGDKKDNYKTEVFMYKKITWSIQSADPDGIDKGYTVALVSVSHKPIKGNPKFFNRNPLLVKNNGTVWGKISKNPRLPNKYESYDINFTITHNAIKNPFPLDPKLQINPGTEI